MKLNAAGVGIRIKQARVAKGWTQSELAKSLGVQRSSVVRWEAGQGVPKCIPDLSKALKQSADWLMGKADEVNVAAAGSADSQELRSLRAEIRRLEKKLAKPVETKTIEKVVERSEAKTTSARRSKPDIVKDEAILEDVIHSWNRSNDECRLMAALILTGDWSYKLRLYNKEVDIDEDVIKALRAKK